MEIITQSVIQKEYLTALDNFTCADNLRLTIQITAKDNKDTKE